MNEHSYIKSIHRLLDKSTYKWKINDSYQGGVADAYYSGPCGDVWIEYKYIPELPKRVTTLVDPKKLLSPLQQSWLRNRHKEGRTVAVVIGSDKGSLILPGVSFLEAVSVGEFMRNTVDKAGVSSYIEGITIPPTPTVSKHREQISNDPGLYRKSLAPQTAMDDKKENTRDYTRKSRPSIGFCPTINS